MSATCFRVARLKLEAADESGAGLQMSSVWSKMLIALVLATLLAGGAGLGTHWLGFTVTPLRPSSEISTFRSVQERVGQDATPLSNFRGVQ